MKESVFVANLGEAHAGVHWNCVCKRLVHPERDRLHIFEICAACRRKTKVLGAAETVEDRAFHVI